MTALLPRPRRRILTTVVALLFVVGAVPLVLLGRKLSAFSQERLQVQQQEYQLVLAEATAREMAELVLPGRAEVRGLARGLEAGFSLMPTAQAPTAVQSQALLQRYLAEDENLLKLVFALRPEGVAPEGGLELVVAERKSHAEDADADEQLVGSLLEAGLAGEFAVATATGERPSLVVVAPVRRLDNVVGVLAAVLSLDGLRDRLASHSDQIYLMYLTDRDGARILARSRAEEPGRDLLASDLVAAFREAEGSRTMPFRIPASGGNGELALLGAFATVAETGWGVFVEVDSASAYHAVLEMRKTTLQWGALSICLALVLGTLFARRIVHPIRELADGALRLARGDFSQRITLTSSDEIGVLAGSFRHMADEIQEQIQQLGAAARENKELFMGTVKMLAEAIDEKDPYTRGHSERVTRYSMAIARELGLGEPDLERVQIGALLHDVGKIGIDDRILRKPSVLTDAEFEIMKQHPEKGAHIMSAVKQLGDCIPGMRFHHEKVDGTGYPLGLKGDEIPVAAQIISVADTFDAMTTDRPYQKGMDPAFVVGSLQGWVGTRFRADVVAAFARAVQAGAVRVGRLTEVPEAVPAANS